MAQKKRSFFEITLVTIVVGLALALGVGLYAGRAKVQKSRLMIQELSLLRSSVSLYKMLNGSFPEDLVELVNATYRISGTRHRYVENVHVSDVGKVIDPFGNPFVYDPISGWVKSTTSGYGTW